METKRKIAPKDSDTVIRRGGTKRKCSDDVLDSRFDIFCERDTRQLTRRSSKRDKREKRGTRSSHQLTSRSISLIHKDGLRRRKRPTTRNLKRQELQKQSSYAKGLSLKNRTTFQPKRQYH